MPDVLLQETLSLRQADPKVWLAELSAVHERLKPYFPWRDSWSRAGAYLVGLLSGAERKNAWQMAEEVGDADPWAFQYLLNRAKWDVDGIRDETRRYALEHLADPDGVLVLDETGFLKKGDKSAGVQRQYTGTAGRIENAQVGVFLAYASAKGSALIDRELYLPEAWIQDPERCRKAGIPPEAEFATKAELGQRMLERAFEAGVAPSWVTGDEVYGQGSELRLFLEEHRQPYVLAVKKTHYVWDGWQQRKAEDVLERLTPEDWHRLSPGDGAKGPRLYDWARTRINGEPQEGWGRWLLFRKSLSKDEVTYYLVAAPEETSLEEMVRAAGMRWAVEIAFEQAKGEVGLDHYEVRTYRGWYRHITLAMLALAYLAVMRHKHMPVVKGGLKGRGADEPKMTGFRQARQQKPTRPASP